MTSARATSFLGQAALQMIFEQAAANSHTNLMKHPAQTAQMLASSAACGHPNFPLFQTKEAAWFGTARELLQLSSEHYVLNQTASHLSAAVYMTTTSEPTQSNCNITKQQLHGACDMTQGRMCTWSLQMQCICKDQIAFMMQHTMRRQATTLHTIHCSVMIPWLS